MLELNKEDNGNRKFILVQLPEPTDRKDYPTIADITKERVRRVIEKLNKEDDGKLPLNGEQKQDRGFRVFKLAESNFKTWNANVPTGDVSALQQQLELHIDHVRDGRTEEDILYEILLKSGFPLTTPVEKCSSSCGQDRLQRCWWSALYLSGTRTDARSYSRDGRAEARARSVPRQRLCEQRPAQGQCCTDFQDQRRHELSDGVGAEHDVN